MRQSKIRLGNLLHLNKRHYLKQTRGCHPFGMAESILFVPDADHADEGMCLMFLMIFYMEDK